MKRNLSFTAILFLALFSFLLVSCGDDDSTTTTPAGDQDPIVENDKDVEEPKTDSDEEEPITDSDDEEPITDDDGPVKKANFLVKGTIIDVKSDETPNTTVIANFTTMHVDAAGKVVEGAGKDYSLTNGVIFEGTYATAKKAADGKSCELTKNEMVTAQLFKPGSPSGDTMSLPLGMCQLFKDKMIPELDSPTIALDGEKFFCQVMDVEIYVANSGFKKQCFSALLDLGMQPSTSELVFETSNNTSLAIGEAYSVKGYSNWISGPFFENQIGQAYGFPEGKNCICRSEDGTEVACEGEADPCKDADIKCEGGKLAYSFGKCECACEEGDVLDTKNGACVPELAEKDHDCGENGTFQLLCGVDDDDKLVESGYCECKDGFVANAEGTACVKGVEPTDDDAIDTDDDAVETDADTPVTD